MPHDDHPRVSKAQFVPLLPKPGELLGVTVSKYGDGDTA